ncbi:MAG: hypothetical protein J6S21_00035 [Victivallales bacterium]|nr:hypothetical protein [Victivallales bacterium]
MKSLRILVSINVLIAVLFFALAPVAAASEPAAEAAVSAVAVERPAAIYWAIAIAAAGGCLSAGYAVARIGAAVMGAAAEKPEIMGKAIAFVGLAEGIALFGFLIAIFLFTKI